MASLRKRVVACSNLEPSKKAGRTKYSWAVRVKPTETIKKETTINLGVVSETSAKDFLAKFHDLETRKRLSLNVGPELEKWLIGLDAPIHSKLCELGLANPRQVTRLKSFCDEYIAKRTDWKRSTVTNHKQTANKLGLFFGDDKPLAEINATDVDQWRRTMRQAGMALATEAKHAKRAKQMFRDAVRAKILSENPFDDQRICEPVNKARQFFVSRETTAKVLKFFADNRAVYGYELPLVFGLCRFAGLRCPSEVLALTWDDIDAATNRMTIHSPKTGTRVCPIVPELQKLLTDAHCNAKEFEPHVITEFRTADINLRTKFLRVLKAAGVTPWPKLFVNLRSTCRTELEEFYPNHVLNAWMGHSGKVAAKHYLQIQDKHFEAAAKGAHDLPLKCPPNEESSRIADNHDESRTSKKATKNPANCSIDAERFAGLDKPVTPAGVERSFETPAFSGGCGDSAPQMPTDGFVVCIKRLTAIQQQTLRDLLLSAVQNVVPPATYLDLAELISQLPANQRNAILQMLNAFWPS